jgi:hypothetical protein
MSQIIYGLFDTRTQAEAAIRAIETQTENKGINALVHEEYLRDEDVQMGGTDALRGAVMGAVVVGILAALVGGLLLIPAANMSVGWTEYLFISGAGTIMGITAGAVAGASEPRKELLALAQRLKQGKVLVTMDADEIPVDTVKDLMAQNGALEVIAA